MQMTQMVQYLLAYRRPAGGRIARYGVTQTTIPIFPPGLTLVFDIRPARGAYANLYYWHRASPVVVPGAFDWNTGQEGMEMTIGIARDMVMAEGHQLWLEVTQANPIRTVVTNTTNLNQFFETLDLFLIVDTEEDMNEVRRLMTEWQAGEAQTETNRLLRALVEAVKPTTRVLQPAPVAEEPSEASEQLDPTGIRHIVGF